VLAAELDEAGRDAERLRPLFHELGIFRQIRLITIHERLSLLARVPERDVRVFRKHAEAEHRIGRPLESEQGKRRFDVIPIGRRVGIESPVAVDSQGEQYDVLDQVADVRSGANPERDLMARELGGRINRALDKLSPRERLVFELKHYQGLKLRTVGEILNTTEETAKNTLFRATQKLRGALADMR